MRLLVLFCLVMLHGVATARPYLVAAETTIHNDNWYPLSEEEMKAAAVDAALSELTALGRYEIINPRQPSHAEPDGSLEFRISLIGPAEVVKLTLLLHLNGNSTYVSAVSMNIHGMDYQGIYKAFEYVGSEAAKRLNTKVAMGHAAGTAAAAPTDQGATQGSAISRLFAEAQDLKRQERLQEARVLFEEVVESGAETQWGEMAADELRYGLPIFEADNLMLNSALADPVLVLQKMREVNHLYRQILADNGDNPQRVVDMNRRLDGMSLGLKQMRNAIKANSLSRASSLRMMVMEYCMEYGAWPDLVELKRLIQQVGSDYKLVSYQRKQDTAQLIIQDVKYDVELQLAGGMNGITLQAK